MGKRCIKNKELTSFSADYISVITVNVKCKWFFLTKHFLRMDTISFPAELKRTSLQSLSRQTWEGSDNSGISGICETHSVSCCCTLLIIYYYLCYNTCQYPVLRGCKFKSMIETMERQDKQMQNTSWEDKADNYRNPNYIIWRLHVPSLLQRSKQNVLINYY